jgi:hypothetical protein
MTGAAADHEPYWLIGGEGLVCERCWALDELVHPVVPIPRTVAEAMTLGLDFGPGLDGDSAGGGATGDAP